jgi:hypothetical protein
MANSPPKSKDPTEQALNAIQEALKITDSHVAEGPAAPAEPSEPAPAVTELFSEHPAVPPRPANDDGATVGQMLHNLQQRPASRVPYLIASIAALAWAAGGIAVAFLFWPELQAVAGTPSLSAAAMVGVAAAITVPILVFYALAHLLRRSHELRAVSESMAGVAMRLAQPETAARESVMTVGQAIRREVAAMGDGVERALARAAELESLVHNEVSAIERAYNDNEVRIRDLLGELANQRETLVAQAEHVRSVIASVHLDLSHDITSVGDLVADKVNEVAQRVTRSLTEKGEHITLALGHAGDSMIDTLGERGSIILERLETTNEQTTTVLTHTSERATATLNDAGGRTTQAIVTANQQLIESLKFKGETVQQEFDQLAARLYEMMDARLNQVAQAFAQNAARTIADMGSRSQAFTEALTDNSGRVLESMQERANDLHKSLLTIGDRLLADLGKRGDDAVGRMEQTGAQVGEALQSRINAVADSFRASTDTLVQALESRGDAVKEMLVGRLQAFDEIFQHGGMELTEKISRDAETLGGLITRHIAEFDRTVKTYGGELVERLGHRTQEVSEAMRNHLDTFDQRVGDRSNELASALDQRMSQFDHMLSTRVETVNKALADGGQQLAGTLDRQLGAAVETINVRGAEVANSIRIKTEELDRTLVGRAGEVADALDIRITRFEELLVGRAEAVAEHIENRTRAAADAVHARMEQLSQSIKVNAKDAERSLGELAISTSDAIRVSAGEAERTLGAAAAANNEAIRASAGEAERTLRGVSEEVARGLAGKADEIAATLSERASEMTHLLSERSGSVLSAFAETGQRFAGEIGSATDEALRAIEEKGLTFRRTVHDNSAEISRLLSEHSGSVLSAFAETGQRFAGEIGSATDEALRAIEDKGLTLSRTVHDNGAEISRLINAAGENASTSVTRAFDQLQDSTQAAIARSQETAKATIKEMQETHGMLTGDASALFERLREANIMLQEVLSGAHENMGSIENTLVTRVSEFVTAMNEVTGATNEVTGRVETNITGFREVTAQLITDLGQLANEFDAHGRELAQSIESIDRSNRRTEDAVGQRCAQLDALVSTIETRTGDIQQRLERFSSLLDQSLETAAARARDVARMVSEATAEGTRAIGEQYEQVRQRAEDIAHAMAASTSEGARAIGEQYDRMREQAEEVARVVAESSAAGERAVSEQYERIRANAEDERRRTSETMRSIYQQAVGDTDTVFRDASGRFTEVMEGMKEMAAEMQRELESTRAELRRGIFDLPQETAESAAQMRRVIVDQIEALAELNRIVARHGRNLDAVEPSRRAGREEPAATATIGGRGETSAHAEPPVRVAPPARNDMSPRPTGPTRSEGPSRNPPPGRSELLPRQPTAPRNEIPGFTAARPQEAPLPAPNGNNRGWLSDLLSRASEPEEPAREYPREPARAPEERTPRHSIESLDSLSVDIARMIDHEAAADLWDRYKRGERNVFTRRLYTMQGQKAFEEIRRKYRGDREFKQTVDRYIGEFERLLEETSREDASQMMARTYLTSETGKVYTMLAHAAGRLE